MLNITTKRNDENLLVRLEGQLDTVTTPQLKSTLSTGMDGVSHLTLDMEELDYVSSAGLRLLLAIEKELGKTGRMDIIHVNEIIRDAFDVTGLLDIFHVS